MGRLGALSRWRLIMPLLALLCAVPLALLHFASPPSAVETRVGEATITMTTAPNRVLFPGQCVVVTWDTAQIQAVFLDGQGRTGSGQQERCLVGAAPTLRVEFRDGPARLYRPPVELLYQHPIVALLLAGLVATASLTAYLWLGVPGLLAVLTVVVFGPMLRSLANLHHDFVDHTMFAAIASDTGFSALPPQFLYHLLTILLSRAFPTLNLENAGFLLVLAAYVGSSLAVYWLLRWLTDFPAHGRRTDILFTVVTLAIMLAGPVDFLSHRFQSRTAVIPLNLYHSPTLGLLKPLAVMLFLVALKLLAAPQRRVLRRTLLLAALTILATLAKPSYTLAVVPALGLVLAYSLVRPLKVNRAAILGGALLPAVVTLGWQYLFLYGPQAASTVYNSAQPARIVFAPFELYLTWWQTPWYWLLPDLLVSILFPLAVYGVYFRRARQSTALNLAWLTFIIGAALGYLFIERPNEGHGNLTWSGQITLFVLFATSTGFWLQQAPLAERLRLDRRSVLCALLLAAHVISHVSVLLS